MNKKYILLALFILIAHCFTTSATTSWSTLRYLISEAKISRCSAREALAEKYHYDARNRKFDYTKLLNNQPITQIDLIPAHLDTCAEKIRTQMILNNRPYHALTGTFLCTVGFIFFGPLLGALPMWAGIETLKDCKAVNLKKRDQDLKNTYRLLKHAKCDFIKNLPNNVQQSVPPESTVK